MKKIILIFLLVTFLLSLVACGSSAITEPEVLPTLEPAPSWGPLPTRKPIPELEQTAEPIEDPEQTAAPGQEVSISTELVAIDGTTIAVRDDGTGESGAQNGMEKRVLLTNRDIGYTGATGPISYTIEGIQISALKATSDEIASMLGIETGKEVTLVAIQVSVENSSDADITFNPDVSTIITSDKEQVTSHVILSDSLGGVFMGKVVKQGQIYWICKATNPDALTSFQWRIEAPHGSDYKDCGEPVVIDFEVMLSGPSKSLIPTAEPTPEPTAAPTAAPTPTPAPVHNYVLNTNTMKFHYPSCSSVKDIAPGNKQVIECTRDEVIAMGYEPCGRCHP